MFEYIWELIKYEKLCILSFLEEGNLGKWVRYLE